jgi:hypothetical protein
MLLIRLSDQLQFPQALSSLYQAYIALAFFSLLIRSLQLQIFLNIVHSFQSNFKQPPPSVLSVNQNLSNHLIFKMKFSAAVVAVALAGSAAALPGAGDWSTTTTTSSSSSSTTSTSSYTDGWGVSTYTTASPVKTSTTSSSYSSETGWSSWDPAYTSSSSYSTSVSYTTTVVASLTTFCPFATTITHGANIYTVESATTLTITDCPCTISLPVYTSTSVACSTWYELFLNPPTDFIAHQS